MWDTGIIGNQDTFAVTTDDGRAMYYSGMTVLNMEGDWFVLNGIENNMNQYITLPPSFREGVPQTYALSVGGCYAVNASCSPEKQELIFELLDILYNRPDLYAASVEAGAQVNCIPLDEQYLTGKLPQPVVDKLELTEKAMEEGNVGHCTWTFFPQDVRIYMYEKADAYLRLFDLEHASLEDIRRQASVSSIDLAIRSACVVNQRLKTGNALYYYNFDAEIPGWDHPGTFHSVDLWFFFETLAKCWRPFVGKHYDLARQMCSYWAYFIKQGNPNGLDATGEPLPQWDACTPDNAACMVFGDTAVQSNEQPNELMQLLMDRYLIQKGFEGLNG